MATRMAPELLQQVNNEFRGENLNRVASAIGESPAKTQMALGTLVPAVLGGLAGRASTPDGANDVVDVIRRNNLSSVSLSGVSGQEGVSSLINTGRSLFDFTHKGTSHSVTEWVASNAGIGATSATSLASVCSAVVLGLIGRRLGSSGMTGGNLSNLLGDPSSYLQNLPAGLVSALGLGGAATATRRFADDSERRTATATAYTAERKSSVWSWLLPLLLLGAALLGALIYMLNKGRQPTETVSVNAPQPIASVASAPVIVPTPVAPTTSSLELGQFVDTKLPNGLNLRVPANGVERKLVAFIEDPAQPADKETWFSFDRLEFETDSARLKPSSTEQLSNTATVLKAYPQVAVKIGGYTDNTGDPAHNLKLSQERATSTVNELASLGIEKSRLSAEGYGQQFPVADNSTPEGRQRNRRIDIRVTNK